MDGSPRDAVAARALNSTKASWPDWPVGEEHLTDLARYVVTDPTRSLALGADLRRQWSSRATSVHRIGQLYELLADRNIRFATDPFAAGRSIPGRPAHQRIRTPEEVLRGVGNCLDLSLLLAGLAVMADLRPLLAVRLGDEPHAMVVFDVGGSLSTVADLDGSAGGPDGWVVDPARPGLLRPTGARWSELRGGWLAVDAVDVTLDGNPGRTAFDPDRQPILDGGPWFLVDVAAVLATHTPFDPPDGPAYPIHTQLPELRPFRDYPGRRDLFAELAEGLGRSSFVVLQGPGGRGKSTLAERLAWGADNGCGWVLDATDAPSLRASLAARERAELGQSDEAGDRADRIDAVEIRRYAGAALERLRSAKAPWVVVLDNCDLAPTPELLDLVPPAEDRGQVVIITTRNAAWLEHGKQHGWLTRAVPALGQEDLKLIGLPPAMAGEPLVENPLTAETVARLGLGGLPEDPAEPHELVWSLVAEELRAEPGGARAVALAELLAWSPPDPLDVGPAPTGTPEENQAAAAALVDLQFLAPTMLPGVAPLDRTDGGRPHAVQLHRMYADAIRRVTWRAGVDEVARILTEVLTSTWGRDNLRSATDQTMLVALEKEHMAVIERECADARRVGLLWQGIGHVRERQGLVDRSVERFRTALRLLDGDVDPYQVAESEIGIARLVSQKRLKGEYESAQKGIEHARELLTRVDGRDAAQLREQGNALYWLIEQHRASGVKKPEDRLRRLLEVRAQLWSSYEQRIRIWRGDDGSDRPVDRDGPDAEAGIGPERAYYNLAGVQLPIAKARFELGERTGIADDLAECERVYRKVAELRALRYAGLPHPHHAACVNGRALVAYHKVTLLDDRSVLPDAYEFAVQALRERWDAESDDVRKSAELLVKIAMAGGVVTAESHGPATAVGMFAEALREPSVWAG